MARGSVALVCLSFCLSGVDGGRAFAADDLVQVRGSARLSYEDLSSFPSDREGTPLTSAPLATRLRLAPSLRYGLVGALAEVDVATGVISGVPGADLVYARTPQPAFSALDLRQLYVELKGEAWVVRAGQQASRWGLGLVANPGAAEVDEHFAFSRFGDLSWRALGAGRPLFGRGGAWRALEVVLAADLIVRDDTADFAAGDRALQGVAAVRFAVDDRKHIGVYSALRRQRKAGLGADARAPRTDAFVLDVAGKWSWDLSPRWALDAGFEVAHIRGTTTALRNDTAPEHRLEQLGAALKTSVKRGRLRVLLDAGYASGDQNPYDDVIQSFRFDPDYDVGLALFEVLGWQSARSAYRAADPMLLGRPPDGVELLPTRGAVTGAWYGSYRVAFALTDWLEVYGGPLLAVSSARLVDPFQSRIGGGDAKNALGAAPGRYLGTEGDFGLQIRTEAEGFKLVGAAEVGRLVPGSALRREDGSPMEPVTLARARLSVSF